MLCQLVEKGMEGPFLVIAPLSALCNWCNDIKMFAPQLPYVLFHGNESVRCEKMKLFKKTSPVKVTLPDGSSVTRNVCPIVVTSYEKKKAISIGRVSPHGASDCTLGASSNSAS
ncbi:ATP-dependent DNA helicase DDM1-like [Hyalella azteca]|uniref:ATP-dependent DNA helicase DDM1-like n=1 Tax=Hyalella azteca TaxID=294128 RepID=A0A979FN50_HYAAZ|nr:ATP-dependent DNA helicase DDM1-like [Hyalella azteca]